MKSSEPKRILCFWGLLLFANLSVAQNTLTIDFYSLNKDVYDGSTPINAVLRAPKNTKWATSECFSDSEQKSQSGEKVCAPDVRALISQCKAEVQKIVNETATRYGDMFEPQFAVVPLSNKGKALLFRSYFGGSGGGRIDWSLFSLSSFEKGKFSCPESPFLSGVEVTPGGNVWYETSCDKQEYAACAEKLFYPKENAFRIEFTKSGTHMSKIPKAFVPQSINY